MLQVEELNVLLHITIHIISAVQSRFYREFLTFRIKEAECEETKEVIVTSAVSFFRRLVFIRSYKAEVLCIVK